MTVQQFGKECGGSSLMKKKFPPLLVLIIILSSCISSKAIRGGNVVENYTISEINLPIEEVHYKNLDGSPLYAWLLKKENFRQVPTIIFLHGSLGNIFDYLPVIKNLYRTIDANIFACDFPGTGASKGEMSLENAYQMTLAAIDYLSTMPDIRHDEIVLYGASMGASLAFYGASKREHLIVIIDSGVTSASDYLKKYSFIGLPDFLIRLFGENFNNYALVKNMKNPKLFLHGKNDAIIDISCALRLYAQASEPKESQWIEGGHVLFRDADISVDLSKKVRAFLKAYLPR
jgi:pimeloyl-ACP methyl ester carboxylesterase